jgi:hypothetical protein
MWNDIPAGELKELMVKSTQSNCVRMKPSWNAGSKTPSLFLFARNLNLLDGTSHRREDIVGISAHKTNRTNHDDQNYCQHHRVLCDVLAFLIEPDCSKTFSMFNLPSVIGKKERYSSPIHSSPWLSHWTDSNGFMFPSLPGAIYRPALRYLFLSRLQRNFQRGSANTKSAVRTCRIKLPQRLMIVVPKFPLRFP